MLGKLALVCGSPQFIRLIGKPLQKSAEPKSIIYTIYLRIQRSPRSL